MNAKFKVGDKVRIVNCCTSLICLKEFLGKEYTVKSIKQGKVRKEALYTLVEENQYMWYESELELVKPKFDINNYTSGKYAIRIRSKDEAEMFSTYFNGLRDYRVRGSWDFLNKYYETCFNLANDCHSVKSYYKGKGYTILEFEDFDWSEFTMKKDFTKKDLKNGDVVKFCDGTVGFAIVDVGVITFGHQILKLDFFNNDLTDNFVGHHNIIAVRRPNVPSDCIVDAFDRERGTLIYERKEVEEMTLEEVCKVLGKEIKIVKEKH